MIFPKFKRSFNGQSEGNKLSQNNLERSIITNKSIEIANNFIRSKGLDLSIETTGNHIITSSCTLYSSDGRHARGHGKGIGEQVLASCIFESIEHLYHNSETRDSKKEIYHKSIDSISDQSHHFSPSFKYLNYFKDTKVDCFKYNSLHEINDHIFFPIILGNPNYLPTSNEECKLIERSRITRYSTNSGTASGANLYDAILHGLLELIERDAIGLEFVRSILRPNPRSVSVVNIESVPNHIIKLIRDAEIETKGIVKIFDVTSDLKIPSYMTSITIGDPIKNRHFGSGCSLFSAYAIERSILEAVQVFHLRNNFGIRPQIKFKEIRKNSTLFRRCSLDAGYFEYLGGEKNIIFNKSDFEKNQNSDTCVKNQISYILRKLKEHNLNAYYRSIIDEDISVVQVLVPKLERIFILSHGIPVAPSTRGMKEYNLTDTPKAP